MEFPYWFVMTPGFRWLDQDGDLCILLGWEPEAEKTTDNRVEATINGDTTCFVEMVSTVQMTYVTWYKNTWMSRDLDEPINWDKCSPVEDDDPILEKLMNRTTTKRMKGR